jgi:TRAP transporter TAXI family solute receptor
MKQYRNILIGAAMASVTGVGIAQAQDVFLKMDSFPPGTTAGQFGIVFTQIVQKNTPYKIQVSSGKAATKSAIAAAKKQVDLILTAPTINHFMQKKAAMYKKVTDADKLNQNLRGIINYALGPYHMIVYEDSGIKTLKDIKGKKVFLGPPAGAATRVTTQIVSGATGYEPGKDFEVMRFDWKTAETAFIDRQMDVYMGPTTVPSPSVQQYALVSKIRFLGIPDEAFDTKPMKAALGLPGRTIHDIPANVYDNQANETAVKTIGSWVGLGSHKWLDEEIVYNMTKVFWENIAEVHATAEWMKSINKESALKEMNIPLHIGAYKYYKENGFNIPDNLIPPEAK